MRHGMAGGNGAVGPSWFWVTLRLLHARVASESRGRSWWQGTLALVGTKTSCRQILS